ncbi:urotensin-2 receptor-like [Protopterus annectens]|uniref:urotensin-2 receptor-like n=1 Tax=Protopterus annectens TaxID=7888 RepID=UPI001CFB9979|nr:urotensin-2 receptor-like [Protopterus annectens]
MESNIVKRNSSNDSSVFVQGNFHELLMTSLLGTILIIMCVFGAAGNIYTLYITSFSIKSGGSLYVYIVNLALADLLYLSTIPFVVFTYFARDWLFGEAGCRILLSLDLLTMHASIFILTVMSLERYKAVVRPLRSRQSSNYRKITSLVLWILSFILTLPMMLMIHLRESSATKKRICFPTWKLEAFKIYLTILFTTSILAPGIIIGYLYIRLVWAYLKSERKVLPNKNKNLKQKVVYMVFCIVLAYWACFLPFWVWQLVKLYSHAFLKLAPPIQMYVNFFVTCLTYSNSCINPFLYLLLTKNYKEYLLNKSRSSVSNDRSLFKNWRVTSKGEESFAKSNF